MDLWRITGLTLAHRHHHLGGESPSALCCGTVSFRLPEPENQTLTKLDASVTVGAVSGVPCPCHTRPLQFIPSGAADGNSGRGDSYPSALNRLRCAAEPTKTACTSPSEYTLRSSGARNERNLALGIGECKRKLRA